MATSSITLLIVTTPEFTRTKEMKALIATYPGSSIISFYTMDMEELALIAKHRILPVPTILIFNKSKVVARLVNEIPNKAGLKKILKLVTQQ